MIVSKCPVRISLVGGSTDLESFLEKYTTGAVVSFPCSLNTYITLHENHRDKFIINYTKNEEVASISAIKNDVARVVLDHFDPQEYLTIGFKSDIFSVGSGLAASSAYLIALIKAIVTYQGVVMSNFDICKLALRLERKFNPLTGQQDPYGCGMMGFKRINFRQNDDPSFEYLDSTFLDAFDMYVIYTGKTRSSTKILKSISPHRSLPAMELVDVMHQSIIDYDIETFIEVINEGWEKKKETSSLIMSDKELLEIDELLASSHEILAHRLCGAGGGGHFAVFARKNADVSDLNSTMNKRLIRVNISQEGLAARIIE